ncbi:MAG TPA: YetF domain-containing protein [Candidatus Dormibacteraeota bacterium]|nr:YetF domain-containing protein [Candidatus Dormibacteraeota bacterium]HEV2476199.1 YetF domain-containing protein [Candidatus Dormibacteraeota bacterium]
MPAVSVLELVVRGVVVYVALLVALRIFGKREVGQFTIYDLVFVLLVANALQPAMTGPDTSLVGGLVLIAALVTANAVVGRLDQVPIIHRLFTPAPAVIIRNGEYIAAQMNREGVTQDEIEMAIREHGLTGANDVKLAVLEADGTISVVPKDSVIQKPVHRVRFLKKI